MSNKLVNTDSNNKKTQKKEKNYVRDPFFVPLHYANSMDIAIDKGSCKRFQTFRATGEKYSFYSTHQKYKRNYKSHKKGDPKLITRERQELLYPTLADAWKAISDNPEYSLYIQASTGLSHKRRDVIVLDFDANKYFEPLPSGEIFGYRSFAEAEKDVLDFVKTSGLPKQSYIYYNKKSGNIQVGWFFDPYDYIIYDNLYHQSDCRRYINMGIGINKLWASFKGMPADAHFTGWQCKNPYNKNYDLREVKFYFNNTTEFTNNYSQILKVTEPFFPVANEIKFVEETLAKQKLDCSIETLMEKDFDTYESKFSENKINADSRNYYEVKLLREWVWQYAREHENKMPKLSEAKQAMLLIEKKANKKIKGKAPKTERELNAICKSVLNWSIKKYNKPGHAYFTDDQRYRAKLYNYAKLKVNLLKLANLDSKLSCRKAGKKLGLSKSTINRYRNLTEAQLAKIQILATQFEIDNAENMNQLNHGNKNYDNKYTRKVLELKSFNNKNKLTSQNLTKRNYYKRDGTLDVKNFDFFKSRGRIWTEKIQV